MLMQFAAATAANGTMRPTIGGIFCGTKIIHLGSRTSKKSVFQSRNLKINGAFIYRKQSLRAVSLKRNSK